MSKYKILYRFYNSHYFWVDEKTNRILITEQKDINGENLSHVFVKDKFFNKSDFYCFTRELPEEINSAIKCRIEKIRKGRLPCVKC